MRADLRCDDALLFVGDQQIAVEVDLGLFLPDTGVWGGVLNRIPPSMVDQVRSAHEAHVRLSSGQKRRIRPLAAPIDGTSVPFMGEGTAPFHAC
ncbi:hypothetical protein [Streptomyces canus]|uniref:hypothetical protein n=1 Tax=Streptomyces canus TaxID=58343 RepID=UPI0003827F8D|nr:hypothetical protein [Streptomyces canus]